MGNEKGGKVTLNFCELDGSKMSVSASCNVQQDLYREQDTCIIVNETIKINVFPMGTTTTTTNLRRETESPYTGDIHSLSHPFCDKLIFIQL